jgi:heme-degrading monooxygenase HmoA
VYAVIRNYAGNTELADQLADRSDEVLGLVSGVPGFRAYYLVRTSDGCTTVSVYDDEEGAAESTRVAGAWIREHASELTASTPQVTNGEVLIGG